ncbi:2-C-methyl-D-erythritol 4-phosphate cytidylyltransferase [Paenibacillus ginsengarvi]|uniref:2-C-methyl-D-erythritol 4-phosphate cytidylyltransferase n=1 Tax=Paenibacillus ginsengarvi TaxID=400777 RepID=A0A3B0AXH6_9BACL|nr:2-C-methyl-D-erythritol 4-phosphate cytidylyltransferase [Paenibacillus ginsengarvi]RKN65170.1 2-C-methyl-D-erythritol 4-phosphate cytidylyltransferase [Paenibacillus ginsengarvi]
MSRNGVVVVAAGKGSRMGAPESKQYLQLQGKPILVHTLEIFERTPEIEAVVLVTGSEDIGRCITYVEKYGLTKVVAVASGGEERQHSVRIGLERLPEGIEVVAVHDGVRPFVTEAKIAECLHKAHEAGGAVLAVPVKDTIKVVDDSGRIDSTPDRKSLWAVQTPQAFRLGLLRQAHELAVRDGFIGTDDAMLVERTGHSVYIVEGDYTNIKITTPDDMLLAQRLLERTQMGEDEPS